MARSTGKPKVVVIDNYDSFTYNLVQYIQELGASVSVFRNDRITVNRIQRLSPDRIVISPGPCTPKEAGISREVVKRIAGKVPILGVCLGHQCIGEVFGGRVVRARKLMHGKTSRIFHDGSELFQGVENPFVATRYHSLVVSRRGFPKELVITATDEDNVIMGLRHRTLPVFGVQFHPESILTPDGKTILRNFLYERE